MTAEAVSEALLAALRVAAGPEHVGVRPGLEIADMHPSVRVRPATAAEVAACLCAARACGAAVVPWGGGTLQRVGAPPARADVVLDCTRLDGVVDWEPADLTAGVLAGTTFTAAQAELAQHGQQIALDAPAAERATLGGLVAANVYGPRRWLYGGWRDQIVGMEMALTNGDVIKSGGRVVKNVQGYDLGKLFTGSLGTLGVITRINVKLSPLPETRCLIVARGDWRRLDEFLGGISASQLRVATLDLLDGASAEACGLSGDSGVALLLEGRRALVDGQAGRLEGMARKLGLTAEAIEDGAVSPIWERRLNLDRVDDLTENQARLSAIVLPSAVADTMVEIRTAAERHSLAVYCWAEAGNGAISARVSGSGNEFGAAVAALQDELLPRLPSLNVVCGEPALQRRIRPWGAEPPGLELMHRLKQRFDPTGVLQPGRFIGGI